MASSIIAKTGDMIRSGREAEERRTDYVCVLALVDTTAPASLVLPVKEALDPRLPSADVRVVAVRENADLPGAPVPDACVALLGNDGAALAAQVGILAREGVPVAIVAESALDVPELALGRAALERVAILSATSAEVLTDRLAEWIVQATDKSIAMAANFPFCRKAKVRELINDAAAQTAAQTAKLGPGAELPSMTASQVRLALTIAAINGQPLALGRIPEVLTAVSAGFGSRMMANKALGKLPFVGWFFKVGMGYLGTQATGRTLQHRFEKRERKLEEGAGTEEPRPSRVRRVVEAVRSRRAAREGVEVRAQGAVNVRLLPEEAEGGFLVYEQEDAE